MRRERCCAIAIGGDRRYHHLQRLALAMLVLGGGCGAAPDVSAPPPEVVSEPPSPPERSWDEQLAAVRAGTATQIKSAAVVTREQFRELATGCEGLTVLQLSQPAITDADLAVLPGLLSLRQLVLEAPIGDAGLETIAACKSLEIVNLPRAICTDAGFAALAELPLLTLLRIGSPHLSDAAMESLTAMPNLRFLHLINTPLTDAGLEPIKRIQLLESFYIDGGRCSESGLQCLLKARPDLHLHVNQLHLAGDEHRDAP